MDNSNRPVQRVTPIRSESQNRIDSNFNSQNSSNFGDTSCSGNQQQYKLITTGNDLKISQASTIESIPFVQQNVNIMNINLSNNTLLQGMSQDPNNSFSQQTAAPKTYLQLSDGRYVQIAQNIQPVQQQIPTFLVQMPYKLLDQPGIINNPTVLNQKQFLLPSKIGDRCNQSQRFVTVGSNVNGVNLCNNMLLTNHQTLEQAQNNQQQHLNDYQRTMINQVKEVYPNVSNTAGDPKQNQTINLNGNIITMEKYQEVCDMLQAKKLLAKTLTNEETVLVEFRLNQQKYQLRMTRDQKIDMERLLIAAGNQQRQMEILQVYQSEQRKILQQRTSVVLNQIINKPSSNIVCNSPQIQALSITKPIYPLNQMLVAVAQNQYSDPNMIQSQNVVAQPNTISLQPSVSLQNIALPTINTRIPTAQASIISVPTMIQETSKPNVKQKRASKVPINPPQIVSTINPNEEMKPARARRYKNMRTILLDDHNAVLTPDCIHSFEDLHDAARRLLPYHILEESKDQRFDEVDRILTDNLAHVNKRITNLKRVASSIKINDIISDSARERLLIKRMQLDLEMDAFNREKSSALIVSDDIAADPLHVTITGDPVIIIDDSPVMSPMKCDITGDDDNDDDDIVDGIDDDTGTLVSTVQNSDHVIASLLDETLVEADNNGLLDSLANYDIQDISNDSIDWNKSDEDHVIHGCHVREPHDSQQHAHRSEEPDLDAAIQSILF